MIGGFFRFLGTVLLSCCDYVNGHDPNRRAIRNYRYQYVSEDEYDHLQINGRANSKRQNHYQYNDDSIRANLLAPSPTSVKASNASIRSSQSKLESNASIRSSQSKLESNARESFHPTNIGSDASNSYFLFNQIKSPSEQSNIKSKAVLSSSPQRPSAVSFAQSNIKSNTSTSSFSTKTVRPDASNSSFLFNQIKSPSEQSNIKSKAVLSSSPQRPSAVSFAQSNIKSNTSTSSFSTKTVRPDASNSSFLFNQIKSPSEQSNIKSKAVLSSSPQRPSAVSFAQSNIKSNTSTSSFSTKTVRPDASNSSFLFNQIKSPSEQSNIKSKAVLSSSPQRPSAVSFAQSNIKSNTSTSSFSTKTVRPDASNSSFLFNQIKSPSEQSNIKSKAVLSSSPQRPSAVSFAQSNIKSNTSTSSFSTKTVRPDASNSSFLFNQIKSPSEQSNIKSKAVLSSSPQRPSAVSFAQSNIKSNTSTSSFSTKTVRPDASNSSFLFNQIKSPSEQSNIKSKAMSSSSPQRPGAVSFAQSNTSTSSFSTKTIQSSSSLRPDATSLSNNFITKPTIGSCMQYVVKSNLPKNSPASKPLPAEFIASSSSNAGPDPKEVGKGGTQRYEIPKNIEEMIKNDIVPPVLRMPLSPDTYADYFAALLYAEDFYYEKYSDYLHKDVALKLRKKTNRGLQEQSDKKKSKRGSDSKTQKDYPFVAFEIKEVPERRPYLLSRDHVHLRPVDIGRDFEPFHGVLSHFERGTILTEFEDDFHNQHKPSTRYDVSFSFNRVCLKRAHRAVSAAASPLLRKILFPKITSLPTQRGNVSPMDQILNYKLAPIPYIIEYERPPLFRVTSPVTPPVTPPVTSLIKNIVLKIYESCKESRILICAPKNKTCDDLVRLIMEKVCEFDIFRANAAFREKELVPDDIMPACIFRRECFACPPLDELQRFRIITSTFVSTFRLYNAGLKAGHFSHIFLLDASSAIEPETIVALVDLVSEETVIVVTGSVQDQPRWVRSDIGRDHGLKESFFERLRTSKPYWSNNPLLRFFLSYEDHQ